MISQAIIVAAPLDRRIAIGDFEPEIIPKRTAASREGVYNEVVEWCWGEVGDGEVISEGVETEPARGRGFI